MTTLYQRDIKDRIRIWKSWTEDNVIGVFLVVEYGLLSGVQTTIKTPITEGLGGKTCIEQANADMNTEVRKKLKAGYVYDINSAKTKYESATIPKPSKGHLYHPTRGGKTDYTLTKAKLLNKLVGIQPKYDGWRYRILCEIVQTEGGYDEVLITYFTSSGDIDERGFAHLNKEITQIALRIHNEINELSFILDGEIYNHELGYNAVASACGTTVHFTPEKQKLRNQMNFYWFDVCGVEYIENMRYEERYDFLTKIHEFFWLDGENLRVFRPYVARVIATDEIIHARFLHELNKGYEGIIIRDLDAIYKHSKTCQFLKYKPILDEEFQIIDFFKSITGETLGSLILITKDGKEFYCDLKDKIGTDAYKQEIWNNRSFYKNKWVTVEFLEYTPDGKPRNPKAKSFRKGQGID